MKKRLRYERRYVVEAQVDLEDLYDLYKRKHAEYMALDSDDQDDIADGLNMTATNASMRYREMLAWLADLILGETKIMDSNRFLQQVRTFLKRLPLAEHEALLDLAYRMVNTV